MSDPLELRRRRVLVVFRATRSATLYQYEVEGPGSDRVLSMYAWNLHGRAGKEDVDFRNPTVHDLDDGDPSDGPAGAVVAAEDPRPPDARVSDPEPDG